MLNLKSERPVLSQRSMQLNHGRVVMNVVVLRLRPREDARMILLKPLSFERSNHQYLPGVVEFYDRSGNTEAQGYL